jgi:hypothetical protein
MVRRVAGIARTAVRVRAATAAQQSLPYLRRRRASSSTARRPLTTERKGGRSTRRLVPRTARNPTQCASGGSARRGSFPLPCEPGASNCLRLAARVVDRQLASRRAARPSSAELRRAPPSSTRLRRAPPGSAELRRAVPSCAELRRAVPSRPRTGAARAASAPARSRGLEPFKKTARLATRCCCCCCCCWELGRWWRAGAGTAVTGAARSAGAAGNWRSAAGERLRGGGRERLRAGRGGPRGRRRRRARGAGGARAESVC